MTYGNDVTSRLAAGTGWVALVLGAMLASPAAAQQASPTAPSTPPIVANPSGRHLRVEDLPPPKVFVTQHRTRIMGKPLAYMATAGETYITNMSGEPIASFFSFAYVKSGPPDPGRPVLFVFNGGPGAASSWLHLGALGPRRVVLDREINPRNIPPFGLADNPNSPLDVTDLVFIDPVGTGFSRAVGQAQDVDFAGTDVDADSVARFIEQWLIQNGRYNSPKFLLGESYGTVRASILPRALMGGVNYSGVMRGITLNGVILVSPSINGGALPVGPNEIDRSVGAALPTMAVTALFHKTIPSEGRTMKGLFDEVALFAKTDYAEALAAEKRGQLSDEACQRIALRLSGYTGLPAKTWIDNGLDIAAPAYLKLSLRDQGLTVGGYDSRYTLSSANDLGDVVADDAAMTQYVPGFVGAFQDLLRDDLKVRMLTPYKSIVWEGVYSRWNRDRAGVPAGQTPANDLATAMRRQPHMQVMIAMGYYDLYAAPAGIPFQVERGGMPQDRVGYRLYESGHMLYLGDTAARFAEDVRSFISRSSR